MSLQELALGDVVLIRSYKWKKTTTRSQKNTSFLVFSYFSLTTQKNIFLILPSFHFVPLYCVLADYSVKEELMITSYTSFNGNKTINASCIKKAFWCRSLFSNKVSRWRPGIFTWLSSWSSQLILEKYLNSLLCSFEQFYLNS